MNVKPDAEIVAAMASDEISEVLDGLLPDDAAPEDFFKAEEALLDEHPEREDEVREAVRRKARRAAIFEPFGAGTTAPRPLTQLEAAVRYEGLEKRGQGGIGTVYAGRDEELKRDAAVKVLDSADPASVHQFENEARVTGQLQHPGIPPVYCRGKTPDGQPFFAMPLLGKGSLAEEIDRFHTTQPKAYGSRDPVFRKLLARFATACRTVAYAHSRRAIHRDLKPQNMMLGEFGEVLVIDWGAATVLPEPVAAEAGSARRVPVQIERGPDSSQASYQYAAPEQLRKSGAATHRSDIYGLGATLYHLLTGMPPFANLKYEQVLDAHDRHETVPPSERKACVPRPLAAVCRKAMDPLPENRYEHAVLIADDLEAFLADRSVTASPDRVVGRVLRWTRGHLPAALCVTAALLLSVLALSAAAVSQRRAGQAVATESQTRLELAAELAARVVGAEIDRRWLTLEADATDPELVDALVEWNSPR